MAAITSAAIVGTLFGVIAVIIAAAVMSESYEWDVDFRRCQRFSSSQTVLWSAAIFVAVVVFVALVVALIYHGAWVDYARCVFKQRELVTG